MTEQAQQNDQFLIYKLNFINDITATPTDLCSILISNSTLGISDTFKETINRCAIFGSTKNPTCLLDRNKTLCFANFIGRKSTNVNLLLHKQKQNEQNIEAAKTLFNILFL